MWRSPGRADPPTWVFLLGTRYQGCWVRQQWLILLPTSETKDVTSNIPCSFNNSLEVCHPWLCLNLLKLFLLLVNRSLLCNEFIEIYNCHPSFWSCHLGEPQWLTWLPRFTHECLNLPHFFWAFLAKLESPRWLQWPQFTYHAYTVPSFLKLFAVWSWKLLSTG